MAKLRTDQLNTHLTKALAPVYLISGDETLIVQESSDAIRQEAKKNGFSERELFHAEAQFDWSQLLSAGNSLSLFSEKKILELRIANGKPGDKGSKAICAYLDKPSPDNCLIIITPKLDSGATRSKWVKTIEKAGCWIPVWPLSDSQFHRWLGERIKKAGLSADNRSIELLASRTEGNLLAAHQEIEKLTLIATDTTLTTEIIAGAVADSARFDIFGMIDKILFGDARGAVKSLQGLRMEGTDATVVLWGLAREIRSLLAITVGIAQGQSFPWAAKQAGVWEKRQPLVQQALKRTNHAELERLLRQANGIDKSIKGLMNTNPWDELIDLTLNLAGNACLSTSNRKLALRAE